jgi:hypothetical protein
VCVWGGGRQSQHHAQHVDDFHGTEAVLVSEQHTMIMRVMPIGVTTAVLKRQLQQQ